MRPDLEPRSDEGAGFVTKRHRATDVAFAVAHRHHAAASGHGDIVDVQARDFGKPEPGERHESHDRTVAGLAACLCSSEQPPELLVLQRTRSARG